MNNSKIKKLKKRTEELILQTSCHGIPRVVAEDLKAVKILWLICFILSASAGIYTVSLTISSYLEYDVVTTINVFYDKKPQFPAVTFAVLKSNSKVFAPLQQIMYECKFNRKICSANDFETKIDRYGYVSYKFKPKVSLNPGAAFGLQVSLNLESIYDSGYNFTGLRIIIHNDSIDSGFYGGYSDENLKLLSATKTDIVVDRIFTYRLDEPYNDCIKDVHRLDKSDSDIYKFILTSTNYSYRQQDCIQYCLGREYYKFYKLTPKIEVLQNAIREVNGNRLAEFYEKNDYWVDEVCLPNCPLECDSIRYETSSSVMRFTKNYNITNLNLTSLINYEKKADDLISFNVFYYDFKYTTVSQQPKMSVLSFISNIGGNFGLFIGISFLSFVEIIQFVLEIAFILSERL